MLRLINAITFIILIISVLVCIAVDGDLSVSSYSFEVIFHPYLKMIFYTSSIIVSGLFLVRISTKWASVKIFTKDNVSGFVFNNSISQNSISRIKTITFIEIFFCLAFILIFISTLKDSYILAFILAFFTLEQLLFLFYNSVQKKFRIGVNKNAVITSGRRIDVIPLQNLKSVKVNEDMISFHYKGDKIKTLDLEKVSLSDHPNFFNAIKEVIDTKNVYIGFNK